MQAKLLARKKLAFPSYSRNHLCVKFPRQAFARFEAASDCHQLVSSSFLRAIPCTGIGTCFVNQPVYAHI